MMPLLLFVVLVFTRFYGLTWGAPYFFHPDENNMAQAIANLSCPSIANLKTCFEPGFYAYGQIYLYLGKLMGLFIENPNYSLRFLSALSSVIAGLVFYKLLQRDFNSRKAGLVGLLFFIFTPVLIQLSHFGTTEMFSLMLFMLALYFRKRMYLLAIVLSLLAATKISNLILFLMLVLSYKTYHFSFKTLLKSLVLAGFVFVFFSPHYLLNFPKFLYSFQYEMGVATGKLPVFYTAQFENSVPIFFQLTKVLLPGLGVLLLLLSFFGFLIILKQKKYYLPFLFLVLFFQAGFTYVKWTRFLVLVYPLCLYFSVLTLNYVFAGFKTKKGWLSLILLSQIFFGLAFFRLYFLPDTRLLANEWLQKQLKTGDKVVTEGANVVDIPLFNHTFQLNSLFLYDLNNNPTMLKQVRQLLRSSDYVVVPSRRVFANYTCYYFENEQIKIKQNCSLNQVYPEIKAYYQELFFNNRFKLIKTFKHFNDENYEETFSVFDHPTVRIFKKR